MYRPLYLDIFWLKDESLSDSNNLPAPKVIAAEIMKDLEATGTVSGDSGRYEWNLSRNVGFLSTCPP
jgi:hypothetical protein